jgi:hypothetical protein
MRLIAVTIASAVLSFAVPAGGQQVDLARADLGAPIHFAKGGSR